jgi:hypothetical protein
MKRALAPAIAALIVAMLTMAPLGSAATASTGGTTQVSGLLAPDRDGSCTEHPNPEGGAWDVTGALVGCWYVDTFVVDHQSNGGGIVASGTETFSGCLGATCGHFFTAYKFTATYEGDTETHGRCHHPITGGDGGFSGASGVIAMKDLPNGCSTYAGHVTL